MCHLLCRCVGSRLREMTQSDLVTREYRRVLITAIVCTLSFLLQAVMWLVGLSSINTHWGLVSSDDRCIFDHAPICVNDFLHCSSCQSEVFVYPWLFYCVPEIVPGSAIILLLCFQSRQIRPSSSRCNGVYKSSKHPCARNHQCCYGLCH